MQISTLVPEYALALYQNMCWPLELPICRGTVSWLSFISDPQSASVLCLTIMVINVAQLLLYSTVKDISVLEKYVLATLHNSVTI